MGRQRKGWNGFGRAIALCASLGLALGGCGAHKPETAPTSAGVSLKPGQDEVKIPSPIPSPEDFTAVGKPTKTIETPNGLVEIYDPMKNFEMVKRVQKSATMFRSNNSEKDFYLIRRIIKKELERQNIDILEAGCRAFKRTNSCVVQKRGDESVSICFALDHDSESKTMGVRINNKLHFQTELSKIYGHYFSSETAQLDEIFEFQCMRWNYQTKAN